MGHRSNKFVLSYKCESIVGIFKNSKFGVKITTNEHLTPNLVSTNSFGVILTPIWCCIGVTFTPKMTPFWTFGVWLEML